MPNLAAITIPTDATNGIGLKSRIWVVEAADDAGTTKTDNEITAFSVGPVFILWEFARNTTKFTVTPQNEDDNSTNFDTVVEGFIPRISKEISKQLQEFANVPLMYCIEDRNGTLRKVGEKYDGAKLTFTEETESRNGYLVTITHKGAGLAPDFVDAEGTIPVS